LNYLAKEDSHYTSGTQVTLGLRSSNQWIRSNKTSGGEILGMKWDKAKDTLAVDFRGCKQTGKGTKRVMLQSIARVYDPLGVTSPLMMDAKEIFGKRAKRNIHGTFLYERR
jgi:hypothetical protein